MHMQAYDIKKLRAPLILGMRLRYTQYSLVDLDLRSVHNMTQRFALRKHKNNIFSNILAIRRKNPTQRNARIESKSILSILASCYVVTSVNAKAIQHNAWCSIIIFCRGLILVCMHIQLQLPCQSPVLSRQIGCLLVFVFLWESYLDSECV